VGVWLEEESVDGRFSDGLKKNIIIIIIITTVSPGCSGQGIIYNVVGTGGGLMHGGGRTNRGERDSREFLFHSHSPVSRGA
jgi:hypothetical protein